MITKEEIEDVLETLKEEAGLDEVALVTRDGLLVASSTSHTGFREEVFAAMSATVLASAETAMEEMGKGIPSWVVVVSDDARLVAMGAGERVLLVGIAPSGAELGAIITQIEKVAKRLEKEL